MNFLNGEIFVSGYDKILLIRKDYSSTTQTDICQTVKQEHLLTQFTVTSKNLFLLHAMTKSEWKYLNLNLSQTGYYFYTSGGDPPWGIT